MVALITGGLGYIASNLDLKMDDAVLYDVKDGNDILDTETLTREMKRVDACYHLGAISSIPTCESFPVNAVETNVVGTLNVARIAYENNVKVIFASTFAIYVNPHTAYGMTKALGEKIVGHYGGVSCRIANVYGGTGFLNKDTVVARLMKGTFEDRGHGAEERDFIHVEQVCEKLIEASHLSPGSTVDVSTGRLTTIDDLVKLSKEYHFPCNIRPSV